MAPARYYFINKTSTSESLSHSSKAERLKIHSHVQLSKKIQSSEDQATPPSEREPIIVSRPYIHRWNSGRRAAPRKRPVKHDSSNSPSSNSSSDQIEVKKLQQLALADALAIKTPRRASTDPFDSARIKVDAEVQRLLLYYVHRAHPNTYHTETHFDEKTKDAFRHDAETIVHSSFDDEANMYTLLASMSSRLRYLERIEEQRDSSPLVSKAIAAIQKRIRENAPMTQRMVFNMFHLGCAEFYRWDVAAALVHLKATKVLVGHLGGLTSIHHSLGELVILGDGYVAAEMGEKPLFSPAELDDDSEACTPQEGVEMVKKIMDGTCRIAHGLLTSDERDIVPAELRWIVLDLAVCLGILQDQTSKRDKDERPANIFHWLHLRNLAIRHRLMALELANLQVHALRVALLIWNFQIFTVAGRVRTTKVVASKLRDTLSSIPTEAWTGHESVHIWILSVGATSAAKSTELQLWYLEETLSALRRLQQNQDMTIATLEEFVKLMSKFLYFESVQKEEYLKLWNHLNLLEETSR